MSGDELAAALYAEQGYLVMYSKHPRTIGSIDTDSGAVKQGLRPLRIIGPSSSAEYKAQTLRASEIAPELASPGGFSWPYFYRVEAAD